MKITVFLLCFLCATAALGQAVAGTSVLSNQPQVFQFPSHPEHAAQKPMAEELSLLVTSTFTYGHGERPLWELAPPLNPTPLGDVARIMRQKHLTAKKANIIWEN